MSVAGVAGAILALQLPHTLIGDLEMRRIFALLAGATVLLPALAFAQKAPPGELGVSAPELGILLMAGAVAAPLLRRAWQKAR